MIPSMQARPGPGAVPRTTHRATHLPAHARALAARGLALPPEGLPPAPILDSWARCADAGLQPAAALQVPVVPGADLARRQEQAAFVRALAQAQLETLSQQIAGSNFLLAFADHEGVILDLYADNRFRMSGADAGIVAGSCWREDVAGTNGLGTALASGTAMAVSGLEHYFLQLGDISCTAAPVRDAAGHIVGVLDASSYFESRQRHTQALVRMAATHIENHLLTHQRRGQLVLAIHPRAEFLGTLSAGLLAFDEQGRLTALNPRVRDLLAGLLVQPGTRFEELFGEPYEQALARLYRSCEVPLRDAMGSSLVARMVGRPAGLGLPRAAARQQRGGAAAVIADLACPSAPSPAQADTATPGFVADDPAVAEACRLVRAAVRLGVPLLLHGETGTGKELLARHAHACSGRKGEFVAVNCAALPADLFEAELFGYAAGAYTGARREGSPGLIVSADGGTLLLDEVRELPLPLQAALLRFLDDQTVRPVGGSSSRRVDVQVLAACNSHLPDEVRAGRFRADLLHRLNTVCVSLPPLRARADLPACIRRVLQTVAPRLQISDAAVARLALHPWSGNFRELRAVLTRALLMRLEDAFAAPLQAADVERVLPPLTTADADGTSGPPGAAQRDAATGAATVRVSNGPSPGDSDSTADGGPGAASRLQRQAAELVRREFERAGRSVSQTSRNLGISRTTVYRHLRNSGALPGG